MNSVNSEKRVQVLANLRYIQEMTYIRGTNSPIQDLYKPSLIFNKTVNIIESLISNSTINPNMTSDELNIFLSDPHINHLTEFTEAYWNNNINIIIPIMLFMFATIGIVMYKDKINTEKLNSLIKWAKHKYSTYNIKYILPIHRSVKAKQSPFIGAQITPQILPNYHRLEGSENLQVKFSIPYRRFQSSDNLAENDEHRITITTFVEKS